MAIRFENLRPLSDIQPWDEDLYARGPNGEIFQRQVCFGKGGQLKEVRWVLFEGGGFCQAPSDEFMNDIEEYGGDPRVAMSHPEMHKKWGGNPDERQPGRFNNR